MKKFLTLIIALFSILFTLGCNNNNTSTDIITSCYPVFDLTSRVVGDKMTVKNLVKAGVEPHDYEPTTQDVVSLHESKLFIVNGLGLEHYTEILPDEIKDKTFTCTENIDIIYSETHSHNHSMDPHVWLDPKNAIIMMENIKNEIVKLDKDNKEYYEANFENAKELLESLDSKFKTSLVNLKSTHLVTSHEAFSYLCKAYGLTQLPISGLSTDDEPTPADIANIINQINGLNVTTIFYEELVSDEIARSIASQTGLACEVLDPIEGISSDNSSDDYISLMEKNLEAILKALA